MKGRIDGCKQITAKHISRKHPLKVRRQKCFVGGGKQENIFKREQLVL